MIIQGEDGALARLGNGLITLEFDKATGHWLSLIDESDGVRVLHGGGTVSPLVLTVGGWTLGTRGFNQMFTATDTEEVGLHWKLEGLEVRREKGAAWVVARLSEGDWRAELHHGLREGSRRVERNIVLEYLGEEEVKLRLFTLRFPFADLGDPAESFLEAPGHPVRPGSRVSALWHGGWGALSEGAFCDSPAWRPPFVGMHRPTAPRSIAAWAWSETEPSFPHADRTEEGVLFSHRVYLASRVAKGGKLAWGGQYIEVFPNEWLAALARLQEFYDEAGVLAPSDTPDWAKSLNLYEVHVGTLTGTSLAPYPSYEPLIADLPRIQQKGFDAVYIMPHVPYPSYSVIDYKDMDIQQGSEEGFRKFIAAAHELGLKVFMDVTIHGVMDRKAMKARPGRPYEDSMPEDHPYLSQNPEWFSKNDRGDQAITYTYSFDHASPSWQGFMAEVFAHYVRDYDLDGFRVDSHTWNFFPNWADGLPYPASASFYGSAQLFRRIRQELAAIKPGVVFYTETCGPLLHTSHEMSYNYDETWILVNMLPMLSRRGILCHGLQSGHVSGGRMSAWDMAQWLAQRRLALPRGAIKMRSLDNHDTYWSSHEFRRETFGADAARAIVALFALIDGGFMDYNGADEGLEEFYGKLMQLRRTLPALKDGSCDYLAVKPSEPMVFAPLWEHPEQCLLPVINLDKQATRVTLPLPLDRIKLAGEHLRVFDHLAGADLPGPSGAIWKPSDLAELAVEMEGYGVRLLAFSPAE